jgi:GNAT superfamily N-acetyltransferase
MDKLSFKQGTDYSVDYKRYNSGALELRTSNLTLPYIKPFLRLCIFEDTSSTVIDHLEVCPLYRNKGLASAALHALCKAADRCSRRLRLLVSPYPVPSLEDQAPRSVAYLTEFYKRKGFALNPFDVYADMMLREPRASAPLCVKRALESAVLA